MLCAVERLNNRLSHLFPICFPLFGFVRYLLSWICYSRFSLHVMFDTIQ